MKKVFKDLERLVSVDTANMDGNKKELISCILKDFFGFAKTSQVLYTGDSISAMLFGINCDLMTASNGLVFSGHIDTVPSNAKYAFDDFCFCGRGTSDMKSFFPCLKEIFKNIDVKGIRIPIIVAVSFDEETSNKGISAIKEYLLDNNIKHRYCIVGEPTSSTYSLSSYGCYDFDITIKGEESHVSNKGKHNAIDDLLKCMNALKRMASSYDATTVKITYVRAGETLNVSPSACRLGFQIRTLNIENVTAICDHLSSLMSADGVVMSLVKCNNDLPPFLNPDSYVGKILGNNNGASHIDFPATTEAGGFQELGIDTVICGPGDIKLAHRADEHIYYSDMKEYNLLIEKCIQILNLEYT